MVALVLSGSLMDVVIFLKGFGESGGSVKASS